MTREVYRISLTIMLLTITCMRKGFSENKDSGDGSIYHTSNEELYNDDSYYGNMQNYDYENYGKKRFNKRESQENENKEGMGNNNQEKLGKLTSIENCNLIDENQLQQLDGELEKQTNPVHSVHKQTLIERKQSNDAIKKRDYIDLFKPETELINQDIDRSTSSKRHPEIYIFKPCIINENVIRRFIGPKKQYFLPTCNEDQYQLFENNHHESNTLSHSVIKKREHNSIHLTPKIIANTDQELLRKVRSQWKVRPHYSNLSFNDFNNNINKYKKKTPLQYLHINRISNKNTDDGTRKFPAIDNINKDNSYALNSELNYDWNDMDSDGTIEKEHTYENVISMNSQIINKNDTVMKYNVDVDPEINADKNHKVPDKHILLLADNKNGTAYLPSFKEANYMKTASSHNNKENSAELSDVQQTQDLSQLTSKNLSTNQLKAQLFPIKKDKTEDMKYVEMPPVLKIENTEQTKELNPINIGLKHDPKTKIHIPTTRVTSPADEITPSVSYIYLQPVPASNSMYLQKVGDGFHALTPNMSLGNIKMKDPIITNENTSNDLITISIDPKTLQNKILHAEFFKKSDVKKTPEMLSIELSPKDTLPKKNSSQQLNVVSAENPLQISTSVNNSKVLITGGDKIETDLSNDIIIGSNISQRPIRNLFYNKNQQDPLLGQFLIRPNKEKTFFSSVVNGRQKKSILISSRNISDFLNDDISLKEGKNSQSSIKSINSCKDGLTKIVTQQAKEKELCQNEAAWKPLTLGNFNLSRPVSPCQRSTLNLENLKNLNEGTLELREVNNNNINIKENAKYDAEYKSEVTTGLCGRVPCPTKMKREADKINIPKLINILKPIIVLNAKEDNEGSEDETAENQAFMNKVNLKGSSDVTFEKGNKKVENKILEGFINSIIANYSKDEVKPLTKETTERNDDGAESLFRLLENSIPKKVDTEELEDKKSDAWNLTPILIPESSISKYGDNPEYAKLGPFDENIIKSFLKKDSIPFLQEEKL